MYTQPPDVSTGGGLYSEVLKAGDGVLYRGRRLGSCTEGGLYSEDQCIMDNVHMMTLPSPHGQADRHTRLKI